jgi:hypothetical protein
MQSYFNWKVTGVAITCSDKRHHIPVHILVCWELLKKEKQFDSKILLKNHIKGLFGLVGIGRGLNPLQVKIALISSNPLGRGLTEQALKSALHYEMHFYAYPCKICCFI